MFFYPLCPPDHLRCCFSASILLFPVKVNIFQHQIKHLFILIYIFLFLCNSLPSSASVSVNRPRRPWGRTIIALVELLDPGACLRGDGLAGGPSPPTGRGAVLHHRVGATAPADRTQRRGRSSHPPEQATFPLYHS